MSSSHEDSSSVAIPGRHNVSEPEDYVCERCSQIPWEAFLSTTSHIGSNVPKIEEERVQLEGSKCCVCQFLWRTMTSQDNPVYYYPPPFEIKRHSSESGDHLNARTLIIKECDVDDDADDRFIGYMVVKIRDASEAPTLFPSLVDFDLVRAWLLECQTCHASVCSTQVSDDLGIILRVIDCEDRRIVVAPPSCQYVTLSYVWGKVHRSTDPASATKSGSFLGADLPRTIEDSITATKMLGFRYIWIDRYCIDQSDTGDKLKSISNMGSIYASAQVTIVAACGEDPHYGLPGIRENTRTIDSLNLGNVQLVRHPHIGNRYPGDVFTSKWASRAWTYQEGYMSRRRLFFTQDHILFVCNTGIWCDISAPGLSSALPCNDIPEKDFMEALIPPINQELVPQLNPDTDNGQDSATLKINLGRKLQFATMLLADYSKRELTFDGDSLNAIIGALNSLALLKSPVYHLWGLPIGQADEILEQSRSWQVAMFWHHPKPSRRRSGFPSWTPVGWAGKIGWCFALESCHDGVSQAQNFKVGADDTAMPLIEYVTRKDVILGTSSPYLQLDGLSVALRVTKYLHLVSKEEKLAVTFRFDTDADLVLEVAWDIPPAELNSRDTLEGILDTYSSQTDTGYVQPLLVVRKTAEGFHERVGLAVIPPNFQEVDLNQFNPPTLNGAEVELYMKAGKEPLLEIWGPRVFQKKTIVLE